ncbi:MAG: hypothetical protein ACU83N_08990 [Gammaproteobacteria bacterium]
MKKIVLPGILISVLLLSSGCTSSLMTKSASNSSAIPAAKAEYAQIVFMRPSSFGGAIQSSVFDVSQDGAHPAEDVLVGIVSANMKVLYETEPGDHLFMVVGENVDFMQAHLAPGRTYYAVVAPRMGWWKARFSLHPVRRSELVSDDFKDWFESTDWYENTSDSHRWAQENRKSIEDKKAAYLEKWENKSKAEKDKLTLEEWDGQ